VNTENILFICGGAFVGLERIIENRLKDRKIGFGARESLSEKELSRNILHEVQPEDLLKFGMIPEFIGRVPIICALDPLTEDDLVRILTEPRNSLVRQYQKLFEMEGVELIFTEGALRLIAREALAKGTGARGLRAIMERLMTDLMFEIPSRRDIKKVVINEAFVKGENLLFLRETREEKLA
jgi:ATP-dependent Clp protease ATP-binding subunit ClpX